MEIRTGCGVDECELGQHVVNKITRSICDYQPMIDWLVEIKQPLVSSCVLSIVCKLAPPRPQHESHPGPRPLAVPVRPRILDAVYAGDEVGLAS